MKLLNLLFKDRSLRYKFLFLPGIPVFFVVTLISINILSSQKEILIEKEKTRASLLTNIYVTTLSNDFVIYNKKLLDSIIDNLSNDLNVLYVMLVDSSDNRILVHSDHSHDGKIVSHNKISYFNKLKQNDEYYKISKSINILGDNYATLHIIFSLENVHLEVARMKQRFLFIILIAVFLGSICSIILAALVSSPIKALLDQTRVISTGDLTSKTNYKSKDLLGQLANEFNKMVIDLRKSRDALEISKNRATALLNAIPDLMFRIGRDGVLLDYQAEKSDLYTPTNPIIGKKIHDLLPVEIAVLIEEKVRQTLDSGKMQTCEYQLSMPDNGPTYYEARIVKCSEKEVTAVVRNVTDQKLAEEAIQEQKSFIQNAIDIQNDTFFLYDPFKGKALLWNKTFEKISGYSHEEISSLKAPESYYSKEDLVKAARYIDYILSGERGTVELELICKDGHRVPTEYSASIINDSEGNPKWLISIGRDISERKRTEKQLQQAQKMEAIGLLAGGVAHDLNNILAGVTGYPELMLLQLPEDSDFRKPIEAVKDAGERASVVVADLLTLARGVASARSITNLNNLVIEYLDSPEYRHLHSLYPQVQCQQALADNLPDISCSPVHIKKCIMNLVTNATESIEKYGSTTLSTNIFTPDSQWVRETGLKQVQYAVLKVIDTGSGIAKKDIEHIFEPFYTKKVMGRSGTGLGLAVVWNTVKEHDGTITVSSSDQGSTFELFFPVAADVVSEEKSSEEMCLKGGMEKILVVDDEPQLKDIACKMLEVLGYDVVGVGSGEEAVAYLKDHRVNLVLLDMLMEPGINGRQTYEQIIKLHPGQKAIITSGFTESDEVKATFQLGANELVKKPYSINQLGQAIKKAINS